MEYVNKESIKHTDLSILKSELVIDLSYPFMGASTDSLADCKCCGNDVIEVQIISLREVKNLDFFLERLF